MHVGSLNPGLPTESQFPMVKIVKIVKVVKYDYCIPFLLPNKWDRV